MTTIALWSFWSLGSFWSFWSLGSLWFFVFGSIFCFVLAIFIAFEGLVGKIKSFEAIPLIGLYLICACCMFLPPLTIMERDIKYTHVSPTLVIRTNDITNVIFVHKGKTFSWDMTDTKYWTATNISVVVQSGYNIFGVKLRDRIYTE